MDLLLWRHAEAVDGAPDLARQLTARGHKQAREIAQWITKHAPKHLRVLVSPAVRAQETATALTSDFETLPVLAPGEDPEGILDAAGWEISNGAVLVVGHQPTLGQAAALAMFGRAHDISVKKGGLWWLTLRDRDEGHRVVVRAVVNPEN